MNGCKNCPAYAKCTIPDNGYRGSRCAALRWTYGLYNDPEIVTNADRIRAMSDEELALYLQNWCTAAACKYGDNYFACKNFIVDGECDKCVVAWLKQPVKDGEDDG